MMMTTKLVNLNSYNKIWYESVVTYVDGFVYVCMYHHQSYRLNTCHNTSIVLVVILNIDWHGGWESGFMFILNITQAPSLKQEYTIINEMVDILVILFSYKYMVLSYL